MVVPERRRVVSRAKVRERDNSRKCEMMVFTICIYKECLVGEAVRIYSYRKRTFRKVDPPSS